MSTETQEILDRAKALPVAEKARLVDGILATLDEPDPTIDALWRQEVEDRIKAYQDGRLRAVPLAEVLAKYQR